MAKYVISDLHGCYKDFIKMLELISFRDTDTMYILGDVINRGKNPIKLLEFIRSNSNMILLLGNHEQSLIDFIEGREQDFKNTDSKYTAIELEGKSKEYKLDLYRYLKGLDKVLIVDNFIMSHAGLNMLYNYSKLSLYDILSKQTLIDYTKCRNHIDKYYDNIGSGYKVICGHTTIQQILGDYREEDIKILHRGSFIYIDCGGVFQNQFGKHACIRLNDFKEYYVEGTGE